MEHPRYYPSKSEKVNINAVCVHLLIDLIKINLCVFFQSKAQILYPALLICLLQSKFIAIKQAVHKDHRKAFTSADPQNRRHDIVQSLPVPKFMLWWLALDRLLLHLDKPGQDPFDFLPCTMLVIKVAEIRPVKVCFNLISCLLFWILPVLTDWFNLRYLAFAT